MVDQGELRLFFSRERVVRYARSKGPKIDAGCLDWRIFRIVSSGKASLRELQVFYDMDDLADFHDLIDLEIQIDEQQQRGMPKMPKMPQKGR